MGRIQVDPAIWEEYDRLRDQGMTQKAAAAELGVHVNSAAKYESRKRIRQAAKTQAKEIEHATTIRRERKGKGVRITPDQWRQFEQFVNEGWSVRASAEKVGISENSGRNRVALMKDQGRYVDAQLPAPSVRNWSTLPDRAKRAFDDFEYFRRVYMGHISTQWQIDTAKTVIDALKAPGESYFVLNCPPGSGKSTLLVDLAAWLTVRDRTIRGLFGSRNARNAQRQLKRLARLLTATVPPKAKAKELKLGLACDAEATLAGDYGLFKAATEPDTWRSDEFVVVQEDGQPIAEKESTWMSYGMDSGFLGNRYDIIFWDDVVDKSTVRTVQAIEDQRTWWDETAESRLEPGGAMFLVGQRVASADLYRYCIDKVAPDVEETGDDDTRAEVTPETPRMYTHIVFKAHDETRCNPSKTHRHDSPAWPKGCLLDPKRLSYTKLARIRANNTGTWTTWYQQEDGDPSSVLIRKVWITGGQDVDELTGLKYEAPGCLDTERGLWETPPPFGPVFYFATVDPSDKNFWSIQAWAYMPDLFNQVFLLDTVRRRMGANELLDYDPNGGYSGVMHDWQNKAKAIFGTGFTHWIVERTLNAQHLSKYTWVQNWAREHDTQIYDFTTTGVNKHDEELGTAMLKPWYRGGRIRLPYAPGAAAQASNLLINEVTTYPHSQTSDQVMGCWFAISTLEQIARRRPKQLPVQPRPGVVRTLPRPQQRAGNDTYAAKVARRLAGSNT